MLATPCGLVAPAVEFERCTEERSTVVYTVRGGNAESVYVFDKDWGSFNVQQWEDSEGFWLRWHDEHCDCRRDDA